ncbi:MAG: hypothetical protein AAFR38_07410 [Planctomycetota bacterium]
MAGTLVLVAGEAAAQLTVGPDPMVRIVPRVVDGSYTPGGTISVTYRVETNEPLLSTTSFAALIEGAQVLNVTNRLPISFADFPSATGFFVSFDPVFGAGVGDDQVVVENFTSVLGTFGNPARIPDGADLFTVDVRLPDTLPAEMAILGRVIPDTTVGAFADLSTPGNPLLIRLPVTFESIFISGAGTDLDVFVTPVPGSVATIAAAGLITTRRRR